jgi:hypothetical protein
MAYGPFSVYQQWHFQLILIFLSLFIKSFHPCGMSLRILKYSIKFNLILEWFINFLYVKSILFSDIKSFTKKTPFSQRILLIHILPPIFIKGFKCKYFSKQFMLNVKMLPLNIQSKWEKEVHTGVVLENWSFIYCIHFSVTKRY